jgi:uncharacterized membrane-anchored protein YitT (DUF2179 family)
MLYRVGSSSGGTDIIGAICKQILQHRNQHPRFVLNILVMGALPRSLGWNPHFTPCLLLL